MSERTILEKLIQDGKDAEVKLLALKKPKLPKLGHGDYGVDYTGEYWRIAIKDYCSGTIDVWNDRGVRNPSGRIPDSDIWLGNILADMKRNSKDLVDEIKKKGKL